jgi:xanthine/uracil permease
MLIKDIEILGIICVLFISVFFYIVRKKLILYHVACALVVGIFVFYALRYVDPPPLEQFLLLTFGLGFYWFGLAIIRIMLSRSVSLNMLASFKSSLSGSTAEEDVAGRLKDARYYHLVSNQDKTYHLTWFGWIFATLTAIAYHIFRIEK